MYWILFIIPKKLLSRWVGRVAQIQWPMSLQLRLLKAFVSIYKIKLEETELPLKEYKTLNDFFTRKLKINCRPLGEASFVHCADSRLMKRGVIGDSFSLQSKGTPYRVEDFIEQPESLKYYGGQYALYYLCPRDYHRVHSPVEGSIISVTHYPGLLWPVNGWSSHWVSHLFFKNDKVVIEIETQDGSVACVLVGATNVGQMSLAFDDSFREKSLSAKAPWKIQISKPLRIKKGEELGMFHMGSTVIVLASESFCKKNLNLSLWPGEGAFVNCRSAYRDNDIQS